MAGFTTFNFDLDINDVDRGVYEQRSLALTQHPSEAPERLVCRVLAWSLELEEGLTLAGDMSSGEEPAMWVHDLTGALITWIEVGNPAPARIHRATKAATRVAIYNHHPSERWLAEVRAAHVFSPERLHIYDLPARVIGAVAAKVERRNRWSVSRNEGTVYLEIGDTSLELPVTVAEIS